ncbi:MAG: hypothetical protein JJU29_01200 [Verrucomicrobia bacterium]|nr:hypothetical protein [Verrucomicrobiota bacterium]MCH8510477.1 hypothetical protein [Kiritimatiellia bacterium]
MKTKYKLLSFVLSHFVAGVALSTTISFDFKNISDISTGTNQYSSSGDVWRATNVTTIGGMSLDATFQIVGTSLGAMSGGSQRIRFVDNEPHFFFPRRIWRKGNF